MTATCTAYFKSIEKSRVSLVFIFCIYVVSFIKLTDLTFSKVCFFVDSYKIS